MYPNVFTGQRRYHPMTGYGTMALRLDPASVQCVKDGGKWDPATGTCASGGIPTWVYIAGGAALVGGAAWYFLK